MAAGTITGAAQFPRTQTETERRKREASEIDNECRHNYGTHAAYYSCAAQIMLTDHTSLLI